MDDKKKDDVLNTVSQVAEVASVMVNPTSKAGRILGIGKAVLQLVKRKKGK